MFATSKKSSFKVVSFYSREKERFFKEEEEEEEEEEENAHVVKNINPGKSSKMEANTLGSISSSLSRIANTTARTDMTKKFKTTNDFCVVQTIEFLFWIRISCTKATEARRAYRTAR